MAFGVVGRIGCDLSRGEMVVEGGRSCAGRVRRLDVVSERGLQEALAS